MLHVRCGTDTCFFLNVYNAVHALYNTLLSRRGRTLPMAAAERGLNREKNKSTAIDHWGSTYVIIVVSVKRNRIQRVSINRARILTY